RPTQRALLLAGRAAPVHQRHRAPAHPRVRGHPERDAQERPRVGGDQGRQARGSRRHEGRRRRQRVLLWPRRHPRVRSDGGALRGHRDAGAHGQLRLGRRRLPLALHHRLDVALSPSRPDPRTSGVLETYRQARRIVMHRRIVLGALLAAALLVPFGASAQKPIKVGFPIILSGPGALFGEPASKGAQMFVDEINAKGGVLGRKMELVIRDTKGQPDEAVRVAREMILKDNVDFLVGTLTSAEGPAVSVVAKENKIVFIAPIPKTDQLTAPDKLHPYVFRVASTTTI